MNRSPNEPLPAPPPILAPRAAPAPRRARAGGPHSAASMTAFWLALGSLAIAIALYLLLAFGLGSVLGPAAPTVALAVPATALAAVVIGIVAIARAVRRCERRWMAVTGLALGAAVLAAWTWGFILLWITLSQI